MEKKELDALLRWFAKNVRKLPWRETDDPYRIWISEVMLQQTQVSRVEGYYARFLKKFPTLESLATAQWSSVLTVWRGLGYYQRGRNLLIAARQISKEYDGLLPRTATELQTIPGIGTYTASAILSFVYNEPVPAIDTNIKRVVQRFCGCPESQVKARAESIFHEKPRSSKKLNYAFMDLGAEICSARNPKCAKCPLRRKCDYRSSDRGHKIPLKKAKKRGSSQETRSVVNVAVACIHRNGEYLVGKRTKRKGGGWEFPGGKVERNEGVRAALKREVKEEVGVEVSVRPPFLIEEFHDENFFWRIHFCRCQILRGRPVENEHRELRWVKRSELQKFRMPGRNSEAVRRLMKMR